MLRLLAIVDGSWFAFDKGQPLADIVKYQPVVVWRVEQFDRNVDYRINCRCTTCCATRTNIKCIHISHLKTNRFEFQYFSVSFTATNQLSRWMFSFAVPDVRFVQFVSCPSASIESHVKSHKAFISLNGVKIGWERIIEMLSELMIWSFFFVIRYCKKYIFDFSAFPVRFKLTDWKSKSDNHVNVITRFWCAFHMQNTSSIGSFFSPYWNTILNWDMGELSARNQEDENKIKSQLGLYRFQIKLRRSFPIEVM